MIDSHGLKCNHELMTSFVWKILLIFNILLGIDTPYKLRENVKKKNKTHLLKNKQK